MPDRADPPGDHRARGAALMVPPETIGESSHAAQTPTRTPRRSGFFSAWEREVLPQLG